MDSQDYLALAAQRRTWPLSSQVKKLDLENLVEYTDFNTSLVATSFAGMERAPIDRYESLADFYSAMKYTLRLVAERDFALVETHLVAASEALAAQDWAGLDSDRAAAYLYLAEVQLAGGKNAEARASVKVTIDEYERFAWEDPSELEGRVFPYIPFLASAYCLLGYLLGLQSDRVESVEYFRRALWYLKEEAEGDRDVHEPRLVWALELYAETLCRFEMYSEALAVWDEILRIRKRDLNAVAGPLEAAIAATNMKMFKAAQGLGDEPRAKQHRKIAGSLFVP